MRGSIHRHRDSARRARHDVARAELHAPRADVPVLVPASASLRPESPAQPLAKRSYFLPFYPQSEYIMYCSTFTVSWFALRATRNVLNTTFPLPLLKLYRSGTDVRVYSERPSL